MKVRKIYFVFFLTISFSIVSMEKYSFDSDKRKTITNMDQLQEIADWDVENALSELEQGKNQNSAVDVRVTPQVFSQFLSQKKYAFKNKEELQMRQALLELREKNPKKYQEFSNLLMSGMRKRSVRVSSDSSSETSISLSDEESAKKQEINRAIDLEEINLAYKLMEVLKDKIVADSQTTEQSMRGNQKRWLIGTIISSVFAGAGLITSISLAVYSSTC